MGLLGSLFGRKKSSELSQLLEKIRQILEDEDLQNSMSDPMIKERIINGLDVDQFPHGTGEFGRSAENPIPVNGALGELVYLSLLKTQDTNQRLLFHRLGSAELIDMYETVSIDGQKWDILYLSAYHPRKSRKAPVGYVISDPGSQRLLYGTNRRVDGFPYGLQVAIRETTKEMIGVPLPPPEVREAEEALLFDRPSEHEERIRTATAHVQSFRS